MPNHPGLRDRKKDATRQAISNVATALFVARGFDDVSVTEIAAAAAVARKTVFNHFACKEDLVFDREQETRTLLHDAIAGRGPLAPVAAVQALLHGLLDRQHPLVRISDRPVRFWRMVAASPALTARACELQMTMTGTLAVLLADATGRPHHDAGARLAAALLLSTVVVAYTEALRLSHAGAPTDPAFRQLLDQGFAGVAAALAGTPYVQAGETQGPATRT